MHLIKIRRERELNNNMRVYHSVTVQLELHCSSIENFFCNTWLLQFLLEWRFWA